MNEAARTILLAEDEAIVAAVESRQLQKEGYAVVQAYSGEKAVEAVRASGGRIDLILMDIRLGLGMDGAEAARQILGEYDIPLLFLSSHAEKEIVGMTEKITSYGYVLKDSGFAVLLSSIHTAFNLHQARQEIQAKEQALLRSGRILDQMQSLTKAGGWEYDLENNRITWTDEVYRIHGVDKTFDTNDVERNISFIQKKDRDIVHQAHLESIRTGKPFDLELRLVAADGEAKWVRVSGRPQKAEDQVVRVVGSIIDITDRKLSEEQLKQVIGQKEILLKELQHRVKNSLAVVSSLISMETENLSDPRSREIFLNARSRVRSVSSVYDRLYRSAELDRIDLRVLIQDLVESIVAAAAVTSDRLSVIEDLEEIKLDTKRAVPLALILNELVTNAVKHSLPGGRKGEIRVALHLEGGKIILTVSDNGPGLPEHIDPNTAGNMGLSLVRMLAEQIRGGLTFRNDGGALVRFEFAL